MSDIPTEQAQPQSQHPPLDPNNPDDVPWKKIWSLSEMRDSAKNWNLSSDAGLLNYMQDFANRLIYKTKELEFQVDGLVQDSQAVHVRVHNTFDQFLMLSNTQFIENRVYEDNSEITDETDQTPKPVVDADKQQEITEEILVPKFTKAILIGLEALTKANHMNAAMEASDNASNTGYSGEMATSSFEASTNTMENPDVQQDGGQQQIEQQQIEQPQQKKYEKLDHYLRYPLPHIIGSQQFRDDDFCGLFVEDSDSESESEEEEEEEDSESSSDESSSEEEGDDEKNAENTGSTTFMVDGQEQAKPQQVFFFQDPDENNNTTDGEKKESKLFEDDEDDIFGDKSSASTSAVKRPTSTSYTSSLSDILGGDGGEEDDLFGDKPTKGAVSSDTEQPSGTSAKKKDPFADELSSVLGGAKKDAGDGDLFSDEPAKPSKVAANKKSLLWDDDEDDLFAAKPSAKDTTAAAAGKKKVTFDDSLFEDTPALPKSSGNSITATGKKSLGDLFTDDDIPAAPAKKEASSGSSKKSLSFLEDDEDDLFGPPKPKAAAAPAASSPSSNPPPLTGLEDGQQETAKPAETKPATKKPIGGVKLFDSTGVAIHLVARNHHLLPHQKRKRLLKKTSSLPIKKKIPRHPLKPMVIYLDLRVVF